MSIWVNTIVNNEENFIWFAIMSVVDFVDKILVYDTSSNDKTVNIIQEIKKVKGKKIEFKQVGKTDQDRFSQMRQNMLSQSKADWILILDGDEIWWEDSIKKVVSEIRHRGREIEGIVVPMIVPVGDIFHFQDQSAGEYQLLGRKGHLTLRAINTKIPGLHVDWPYGKESYLDSDNQPIQQRDGMMFLDAPYLHVTHLKRSNFKRAYDKFKFELGEGKKDFKYPEVFYKKFPSLVSSPWIPITGKDLVLSKLLTPLNKIKRRLF